MVIINNTELLIIKSIVMEYCNNGDLFQKIVEYQKKGTLFPEVEIWNIFIQVKSDSFVFTFLLDDKRCKSFTWYENISPGFESILNIMIHYIITLYKSANIFLNKDGTIKLGDLNVSKVAKKGLLYTQTGTPYYAR